MTPADGKLAFVCLRQRLGYCGICYNDTHAKTLEKRMLQRLQKEMVDPSSPLFSSAYSTALGNGTAETVTVPNPKPKPKPKAKGAASKPKSKPKAKQKSKAKAKSGSGLAKTTVQRTRVKKKVSRSKGKKTKKKMFGTRWRTESAVFWLQSSCFGCKAAVSAV
jgi:hypothetical protein